MLIGRSIGSSVCRSVGPHIWSRRALVGFVGVASAQIEHGHHLRRDRQFGRSKDTSFCRRTGLIWIDCFGQPLEDDLRDMPKTFQNTDRRIFPASKT